MIYHFDFSILGQYGAYLLEGVIPALWVAIPSIIISTVAGIALAVVFTLQNKVLRGATVVFVDVFRTVPVICLMLWVHYVLPIVVGLRLTAIESATIALSLNGAAFICEAFRGVMDSIPETQRQASKSLGFSSLQTLRYVVFPQAVFATLPAVTNVHITIIKLVPVALIIAVPEVMFRAQELTVQFFRPIELYTGAALIYVGLVIAYAYFMRQLEKLRKWEPV
jgi:polar amino acid transport system permease protein